MTSQTGENRHAWSAAVGVLAIGLIAGIGAPAALAQPEPTPVTDAPPSAQGGSQGTDGTPATPTMTADEALAIIATEYDTGAGGGQISTLIHDIMTLRSQGFRPSNGNKMAIQEALDKRPNQTPLIDALKATLNFQITQKRRQAAAGAPSQGGFNAGINQLPPGMAPVPSNPTNPGVFLAPSGGVTQPIG